MLNIQPNTNNNISMQGKWSWKSFKNHAKQSILDAMPSCTFNDTPKKIETLKKVDGRMSRPAENRGIMGLFALILHQKLLPQKKFQQHQELIPYLLKC